MSFVQPTLRLIPLVVITAAVWTMPSALHAQVDDEVDEVIGAPVQRFRNNAERPAARTARSAVDDLTRTLVGPGELTTSVDIERRLPPGPNATCEVLYNAVTQLEVHSTRTRPDFPDNAVNGIASLLGTIWPPAYLLMILPEIARGIEDDATVTAEQRLRSLRTRLAAKQCFVR
jgi:hypothetical protein